MKRSILVTGGAGFIGSHLVKFFVNKYNYYTIVNLDLLTYASNYEFIKELEKFENYSFYQFDINNTNELEKLFLKYNFDSVINLAAESHVDNSLKDPILFAKTNVLGTINLLNTVKKHWTNKKNKLFYHISTDEVYGSLGRVGSFTEDSKIDPRSPYSASKASSDFFVKAYGHSFDIPYIISNCSNNFGSNQHKEKLIPVVIDAILKKNKIPIYGDGSNIRDWIYVNDHVEAIDNIFHSNLINETFNIGGNNEMSNLELVKKIILLSDKILNRKVSSDNLITFVKDRQGHDYRYSVDFTKLSNELNWQPKSNFEKSLINTIRWYLKKK